MIPSSVFCTSVLRNAGAIFVFTLLSACGGSGDGAPATGAVLPEPPVTVSPPVVSGQPASLTVAVGSTAMFSVTASGGAPLTYQWKRNGVDIAGATSASYSVLATLLSDTRSKWSVVVRNAGGVATSTDADLYVTGIGVFAGQLGQPGNVDGDAASARFSSISGLVLDKAGNLLAADRENGALRKITPAGQVSTVASGRGYLSGLALDAAGNTYVTSGMSVIKLSPDGTPTTMTTAPNCTGRGWSLCLLTGIALDGSNNVYAANNVTIRKVAPDGSHVLLEGADGGDYFSTNSTRPRAMAFDGKGSIYVIDSAVRKIDAAGTFTLVAGGFGGDALDGTGDANGFSGSSGGAVFDAAGNLYITDSLRHIVRKVTSAGVVTTVAGLRGENAVVSGALPGGLSYPLGIAIDAHGDLYVGSSSAILKIQFPPR